MTVPGWHPDPTGRHEYRYFDGSTWTSYVADAGTQGWDPYFTPRETYWAPPPMRLGTMPMVKRRSPFVVAGIVTICLVVTAAAAIYIAAFVVLNKIRSTLAPLDTQALMKKVSQTGDQSAETLLNGMSTAVQAQIFGGTGYSAAVMSTPEADKLVLAQGVIPFSGAAMGWQVGGTGSTSWISFAALSISGRCFYIWQSASGTVTHGTGKKPCTLPTGPEPDRGLFTVPGVSGSGGSFPPPSVSNPIASSIATEKATPGSPQVSCNPATSGIDGGDPYVCFDLAQEDELWDSPVRPVALPTYHGGPIQAHPIVYIVSWGASPADVTAAHIFATQGLDSPWSAVLSAYRVGAGSLGGQWSDTDPVPSLVNKQALETETAKVVEATGWQLGPETQIWFLVANPISIGADNDDCGFHTWNGDSEGALVVVTDTGNSGNCDEITGDLAHEYAESATNPDTYDGWVAQENTTSEGTEIADVCEAGGWALSPAGLLPMLYAPDVGCTWGNWAPAEVWGYGASLVSPPDSWTQCTGSTTCGAWLYYPPGYTPPAGIHRWSDPSGGYWVVVPG